MKNIVLTGFMGTGKSAVGRELSRLLGMHVIDIDEEIESSQGMSVSEIFRQHGEEYFRQLEHAAIAGLPAQQGIIISTGGGAVLREDNIQALQACGIVFCLTASPETILRRTEGNNDRPLLQCEDRYERISEMLRKRQPFYEKSGILIDTEEKTPLQVAEEIIGKL